jgi:hypothetical protein
MVLDRSIKDKSVCDNLRCDGDELVVKERYGQKKRLELRGDLLYEDALDN